MSATHLTDAKADLEAICESVYLHRPIDSSVVRRVRDRAEKVQEKLRKKGSLDIAVNLLRESRNE